MHSTLLNKDFQFDKYYINEKNLSNGGKTSTAHSNYIYVSSSPREHYRLYGFVLEALGAIRMADPMEGEATEDPGRCRR